MEITKDLIEYDITTAAIEEMKKKYSGMKITDAKSDKAVRAARTFMVSKRTAVEKRRVELNASANEWRKKVNDKAKEITALLLPIEESLQAEVKRVDDEIKAKREEEDRQERERIEAIQEKINAIRALGIPPYNVTSSAIKERLILVQNMKISEDTYMEFVEQAIQAQWETITALKEALAERLQFEKEEVERNAEAERLEKVRKEQEEAQKKIDEENRKLEEEIHRFERAREIEKIKKEREEFERQATVKAEQEAKEKVEREQRERIKREEAEVKEKARQEALRPDKEKLIKFADELLDITYPHMESAKAIQIIVEANAKVNELATEIKKQASKL